VLDIKITPQVFEKTHPQVFEKPPHTFFCQTIPQIPSQYYPKYQPSISQKFTKIPAQYYPKCQPSISQNTSPVFPKIPAQYFPNIYKNTSPVLPKIPSLEDGLELPHSKPTVLTFILFIYAG